MIMLLWPAACPALFSQCHIALDTLDEFDSVRTIAAAPLDLGYLVATGNVTADLKGTEAAQEAKAIFSFADENGINSFFLTLGTVERKYYSIGKGFNVLLKLVDGPIVTVFNVPEEAEFDRKILMWKYLHTCVVPLEIFQMLKNSRVEKIRIEYDTYKSTLVLEEPQQIALQEAVRCVELQLASHLPNKP